MFDKRLEKITRHKIVFGVILFFVLVLCYFWYTKVFTASNSVKYAVAQVKKGNLIVSVSGSGQVVSLDQIDIKLKVSGEVTKVFVQNGDVVKAGAIIAKIDSTEAEKSVRNAELNLENAKLQLIQLKNSIYDNDGMLKAENDLKEARENGFNAVSNSFIDLNSIVSGLNDILFGFNINPLQWNIGYYVDAVKRYDENAVALENLVELGFNQAQDAYNKVFKEYQNLSRFSEGTSIDNLIENTYQASQKISEAVKSASNFIQFYKNKLNGVNLTPIALADTHISTLNSYTNKINVILSNLLSAKTSIENAKKSIINAPLNIQSQELSVKQAENALLDAKENLSNYLITAPFDGIITGLNIKKGDNVNSGTVVCSIISKKQIAEISLNEVDVTKVKIGQKATLTFDALPDFTAVGKVFEMDTVGTISQGVVTYNVKIGLDTYNDRIKPGMSVSAAIIVDTKTDVLLIPNSAIKTQGEENYVQMPRGDDILLAQANPAGAVFKNPLSLEPIQIGISNDEMTEVVSGLKEGDYVVIKTIQPTVTKQTIQQGSSLRIPGLTGGGFR